MPSALEERLIKANYVPWDSLNPPLNPGDVIHNQNGIHRKWGRNDCFENLPAPTQGSSLTIQSVTIDRSEGSFALKFLEIAGAELSASGVTSFKINLTDVQSASVPTGWLSPSRAAQNCRADLESDDYFPVYGIVSGKISLTFFQSSEVGVDVNVTDRVTSQLQLEAKGFTRSQAGDSITSKDSQVLGFMLPDISARDFVSLISEKPRRRIKETTLLNSYMLTEMDKQIATQWYRMVTEQKDRTHSVMMNTVFVWIGDEYFALTQYKGATLRGKPREPLAIAYSTSGQTTSKSIWDEEAGGFAKFSTNDSYKPIMVASVSAGQKFSVDLVSKGKNTICMNGRPSDFITFIGANTFEHIDGLTFLFLVHKDIAKKFVNSPINIFEMQTRLVDGRRMFVPVYFADFMIDNLRQDYGEQAMDRFFFNNISTLKARLPNEPLLEALKSQDFEGYRVTFVPLTRPYAISFDC
jgi:hypothetical protein